MIRDILGKPFEWHMYGLGYLMVGWLYIQIVISPMAILAMLSLVSFEFVDSDVALNILYSALLIGFIIGIYWAERVRRTHGVLNFHSYLLSTPEIDGWRDRSGNVIARG
ncbi:hypothetical protein JK628_06885 [Shewanella sp. KX20019]|uniref:hypothetical protein n=1 Tax=Shewanella sp. KX20019 TaxID=2803864 RepID=UPI0019258DCE|nr:hypothetical protein [Shewanella sp. KX20019]QQX81580.1 hypothetical protein JK628_06885 [Shewanella sp. KX20019]